MTVQPGVCHPTKISCLSAASPSSKQSSKASLAAAILEETTVATLASPTGHCDGACAVLHALSPLPTSPELLPPPLSTARRMRLVTIHDNSVRIAEVSQIMTAVSGTAKMSRIMTNVSGGPTEMPQIRDCSVTNHDISNKLLGITSSKTARMRPRSDSWLPVLCGCATNLSWITREALASPMSSIIA